MHLPKLRLVLLILFQSNQSKPNCRFFPMINSFSCPPKTSHCCKMPQKIHVKKGRLLEGKRRPPPFKGGIIFLITFFSLSTSLGPMLSQFCGIKEDKVKVPFAKSKLHMHCINLISLFFLSQLQHFYRKKESLHIFPNENVPRAKWRTIFPVVLV